MPMDLKPLQIPDPMESFGRVMQNALIADKLSASADEREQNALANRIMKAAVNPDGTTNRNKYRYDMAQAGRGTALADQDKTWAEVDNQVSQAESHRASALKAQHDALGKYLSDSREFLRSVSDDPTIGLPQYEAILHTTQPLLASLAGEERAAAIHQQRLAAAKQAASTGGWKQYRSFEQLGAKDASERHTTLISEMGGQKLVSTNKYGDDPNTKVVGQFGAAPKGGVTVNVGGGKKYGDKMEELQAEHDFAKGVAAETSPLKISEFRRGADLVDRAFTGYWANAKTTGAAATNTSPDAVQATQELSQILSGDMLKNIGSLRTQYDVKLGSVTEKEFDQLQRTMPRITDSPRTIKDWFKRAENIERKVMVDYERLVKRRGGNPVTAPVSRAGMIPEPPTVPTARPTKGTNGKPFFQSAIDDLVANPRHAVEFDAHFGKGSAALILGGTQPENHPLP